jgi:hypothetical protein
MQKDKINKSHISENFQSCQETLADESHFVFITDESGIGQAFETIKSMLGGGKNNCLTLIYSVPENPAQPLFKAELESIEKRYPAQILTYYVTGKGILPIDQMDKIQQILEIVINCNTRKWMQFRMMVRAEQTETIAGRLTYLGINPTQIIYKPFNN